MSDLTLLLGGARSGKSKLAAKLMTRSRGSVGVIATAEALDQEMEDRIAHHRESRPDHWLVVEEPIDLERAITSWEPETGLIIDCLTLWVSNLMGHGLADPEIEKRARGAAVAASARDARTVAVSNEVGSGIVPDNGIARRYRDLLGLVNTVWAENADRVLLMVAGGVVPVQRPGDVFEGETGG